MDVFNITDTHKIIKMINSVRMCFHHKHIEKRQASGEGRKEMGEA